MYFHFTFLIQVSFFSSGQQGQVERLNGTVKFWTAKSILNNIFEGAEKGHDFEELMEHELNWVHEMERVIGIYNNTPKQVWAKHGTTPLNTHNPELIGEINEYFAVNSAHLEWYKIANEKVSIEIL